VSDRRERGSATVEFALVVPTAAVLLGALWAGAMWAQTTLVVQDAAAVGARVAVTQSDAAATQAAARVAGDGSEVAVRRDGAWVHITVTAPGHGWLPATGATASTWAGP
jgi:hypothetical protein